MPAPASAQDLSDTPDGVTGWDIYLKAIDDGIDPAIAMGLPLESDQGWVVTDDLGTALVGPLDAGDSLDPEEPGACDLCNHRLIYKTFTNPDGGTTKLLADEYDPQGTPPPAGWPVMILVHGGGFISGARGGMSAEALVFSGQDGSHPVDQAFLVLSIDYRLDAPWIPNSTTRPEIYYGWNWRGLISPPGTGEPMAAVHDVQDAVAFARTNASLLHAPTSGKVVLAGSSAGGNLAYTAAALSSSGATNRPDGVAGWSGQLKFERTDNGFYFCDANQSKKPDSCRRDVNRYLGCQDLTTFDQACVDDHTYHDASLTTLYAANDPPVLFANGGGPTAGVSPPEPIGLNGADDFLRYLDSIQFPTTKRNKCVVDTTAHATAYLYDSKCESDAKFVWQRTDLFLKNAIS